MITNPYPLNDYGNPYSEIKCVKELVSKELCHIKSIADLARRLKVPPTTLRRHFTCQEGITLSKYILRARMDSVIQLLLNSNMDFKAILFTVGFSREDVGARTFKNYSGLTMGQFQKLVKRNESSGQFSVKFLDPTLE